MKMKELREVAVQLQPLGLFTCTLPKPPDDGKNWEEGDAVRLIHDCWAIELADDDDGPVTPAHKTAAISRTNTRKVLAKANFIISSFKVVKGVEPAHH